MRNRTYGGVRGRKMTVGGKQPTSFSSYSIYLCRWKVKRIGPPKIFVESNHNLFYLVPLFAKVTIKFYSTFFLFRKQL